MRLVTFLSAAITRAPFFIAIYYRESEPSKELFFTIAIFYLIALAFLGLFFIKNEKLFKTYLTKRDTNILKEVIFGKSKNQSLKGSK